MTLWEAMKAIAYFLDTLILIGAKWAIALWGISQIRLADPLTTRLWWVAVVWLVLAIPVPRQEDRP